jgi:beta-phosphoglucomutase-like phosphatase (HAD superfamily)
VAAVLLAVLRREGVRLPRAADPHGLLARLPLLLAERGVPAAERQRLVELVDRTLTREEIAAARCAEPTPGAVAAVSRLAAAGVRLGVVSNNARAAVEEYLHRVGLAELLAKHVVGRPADPARMKPDPGGIHEALRGLDVPEEGYGACVYVGDAPTDAAAARATGIRFLGWTGGAATRHKRLRAAGVAERDLFDGWSTFPDILGQAPPGLITAG